MEGITILNAVEQTVKTGGWSWPGFIAGIIALTLLIVACTRDEAITASIALFVTFLALLTSIILFGTAKIDYTYNKYEVLLDDGIDFKKFYNTYEILEQRGDIYVIAPREKNGEVK